MASPVGTYKALVIGISQYKDCPPLEHARAHAERISAVLKKQYSFGQVSTIYDAGATRASILQQFRTFASTLNTNDTFVIYFSGNSYFDTFTKKAYWITWESRNPSRHGDTAVSDYLDTSTVVAWMLAMKARHVLLLNDACFNGVGSTLRRTIIGNNLENEVWYKKMALPGSLWVHE